MSRSVPAGAPRRLQIYVSDFSATGVVRNAVAIANAAAKDDFDVRILTCDGDGELRGELGAKVAVIDLLAGSGASSSRKQQQRRAFGPYREHIRIWRPDVLFSAGNHGHLLSGLAWAGMPGCKILRISNALDQERGAGWVEARWRSLKLRGLIASADRLVLVSHALGASPALAPLVESGKAVVIPNGVDLEKVRQGAAQPCPHPWLQRRDVPVVLAVGRHVQQKNFDVLLRGFALARQSKPIRLLFLGEGKAEAVGRLEALAGSLGVREDVAFEPPTSNPFSYMAAASVFALPSLWEGSSNVLLEALACGTPTIAATTAGDARLILEDGRYGILAEPDAPRQWSEAILRQIGADPIVSGSRVESFTRDAALARYLQLFKECAGRDRA